MCDLQLWQQLDSFGFANASSNPSIGGAKAKRSGGSTTKYIPSSTESGSYDLVRAVRINGQPRHKFVLGFGSPVGSRLGQSPIEFWMRVLRSTKGHGFTKAQQSQIIEQLKRKGIPLPTLEECKKRKAKSLEFKRRIRVGLARRKDSIW